MPPTITLATESDGASLAHLMTTCFSTTDIAWRLIWGAESSSKWQMHDDFGLHGLFTPVQKPARVTYKAISEDGEVIGFVTWSLPKGNVPEPKKSAGGGGFPEMPGVNMDLFLAKSEGPTKAYERDVDPEKDMLLSFLFVKPYHQRQGVASQLLRWGKEKADELGAKMWVVSTPYARPVYEKHGWKLVEVCEVGLERFGGEGTYERAWMVREPEKL